MGIFSGVKNTYRKSEAAVVVQKLLEHQSSIGIFGLDPATSATQLVATIWNAKPDIFNGEFGQRPHKISVAASALANGLNEYTEGSDNQFALAFSLGRLLSEVKTNGQLYPLNSLDTSLLSTAAEQLVLAMETTDAGNKSHEVPKNDRTGNLKVRDKGIRHLTDSSDNGLKNYMSNLGFDILPAGIEAINRMIDDECLTDFEAAYRVALLTLARDIKEGDTDALRFAAIKSKSLQLIDELEGIKDLGLMNHNIWLEIFEGIHTITLFNEESTRLIDALIGGGERLAVNTDDYGNEDDTYNAANEEPGVTSQPIKALEHDNDDVSKMIDLIAGTLSAQKALMSDEYDMLPDKAKDEWSLGYIVGYSDALLQRKGIDTDATGLAIMTIVFITIFGEEQGPTYFRKFMDLQKAGAPEIFVGMKKGGNEAFTWLSDTDKIPMGWVGYVRGIS